MNVAPRVNPRLSRNPTIRARLAALLGDDPELLSALLVHLERERAQLRIRQVGPGGHGRPRSCSSPFA